MTLKDPYEIIAIAEMKDTARRRKETVATVALSSALTLVVCLAAVLLWLQPRQEEIPKTILLTSADCKGSYELPDGTTVWLNRGSSLTYAGALDGKTRTVSLTGEAYFDVAKDAAHPFIVEARDLSIRVLGTKFTVTSYEDRPVSACLAEGSISADLTNDNQVTLTPGQMLVLSEDGLLESIESVNALDHTSWIGDRLVFRDTPLTDIARSLEHWYGIRILLSDEGAASKVLLSLTVKGGDAREVILPLVAKLSHAGLGRLEDGTVCLTL
ncbi:MAG: FecR domain-containing protein [Bacteroidales bacterium]|nr:FecR domain-containing protein [Bacteroidales bacterium]